MRGSAPRPPGSRRARPRAAPARRGRCRAAARCRGRRGRRATGASRARGGRSAATRPCRPAGTAAASSGCAAGERPRRRGAAARSAGAGRRRSAGRPARAPAAQRRASRRGRPLRCAWAIRPRERLGLGPVRAQRRGHRRVDERPRQRGQHAVGAELEEAHARPGPPARGRRRRTGPRRGRAGPSTRAWRAPRRPARRSGWRRPGCAARANVRPSATARNSSSIGSISGEWNAWLTGSRVVLRPCARQCAASSPIGVGVAGDDRPSAGR